MAILPPPIPRALIRAWKEGLFQGLSIEDQDEIYAIIEIMNNTAGKQIPNWVDLDADAYEEVDPTVDWCLKRINSILKSTSA